MHDSREVIEPFFGYLQVVPIYGRGAASDEGTLAMDESNKIPKRPAGKPPQLVCEDEKSHLGTRMQLRLSYGSAGFGVRGCDAFPLHLKPS